MKILQLRFKNLNSLQGEWFIDFTADEYVANGIFAITGPTGSGKSTILDAICLALYGITPRLDRITQSHNEIMAKKTGECFAEVVFSSQLGSFKCHWSQKRSRGKADGNLQAPKHEISDAETGKVIEAKRSEIIKIVEEKTGMDFLRFTRSILLAQGGFSAFLQATGTDRSEILEQITGTGIYSIISTRVFERQRQEKVKLEQLHAESAGITLLSAEEEAQLQKELGERHQEFEACGAKSAESNRALQWLTGIETLNAELAKITHESLTINERFEAFAPQRQKLKRAEQADELAAEYTTLSIARQQQQTDAKSLESLELQMPELQKMAEEQLNLMQGAEQHLLQQKTSYLQQQPVFQSVRSLDSSIAEKKKLLGEAEKECENLGSQIKENGQKIENIALAQQKAVAKLEKITAYLSDNARDEQLISQFSAISSHIAGLKELVAEELRLQNDLETQQQQIKKGEKQIKNCEAKFNSCCEEHQALTKDLAEKSEKLKSILQGRLLREYRQELSCLLKEAGYLRTIKNLEDERSKLEDGKPCSLCGSLDHPFARGNVPELDENEKKTAEIEKLISVAESIETTINDLGKNEREHATKVAEAEKKLINARHEKEAADQSLNDKSATLSSVKQKNSHAREAVLEKLKDFAINEIADENPESVLELLRQRLDSWQAQQAQKSEIEAGLAGFAADLKGLEGIAATLTDSLNNKKTAVAGSAHELQQLKQKRQDLFADKNPDKEESALSEVIIAAEKAVKQHRENHEKTRIRLTEVDTAVKNLQQSMQKRANELELMEKDFVVNLERLEFKDEAEFKSLQMARDTRNNLVEEARVLEKSKTEIVTRQLDLENRLKTEQAKTLTMLSINEIQAEIAGYDNRLKTLGEELGAIKQKLADNLKAAALLSDRKVLFERQTRECQKWDSLHVLIGSKEGTKFRNFAQGMTFGIMVNHANQQLQKMTDRYLLTRDTEELLELKVIDQYQAGEVRSTKNLSGGESFIVSLALALGLAKMASRKVRVDSLFLDEGFGTLDDDALQTALETLSALQQDEKLIGVISHVSALKQRISTQITVKKGPGGRSTLSGPGVEKRA